MDSSNISVGKFIQSLIGYLMCLKLLEEWQIVEPDQMPYLGLECLHMSVCPNTYCK